MIRLLILVLIAFTFWRYLRRAERPVPALPVVYDNWCGAHGWNWMDGCPGCPTRLPGDDPRQWRPRPEWLT